MSQATTETNNAQADHITVSVHQLLVFTLDSERYAAPITQAREVVKNVDVTQVPGSPEFIVGVMNLRGKIIPVIDLEKLFHLQRVTAYPSTKLYLIIEHTDGNLFGVLVDLVTEIIKIAGDSIQPAPSMVTARIAANYIEGVVVTHDKTALGETTEDVLLLLSLQKIIAKEVVATAAVLATKSGTTHQEENNS